MDNMFHLKNNMNEEEFQAFKQDRLHKAAEMTNYLQSHEENMQMNASELKERYVVKQETVAAPIQRNMPPQDMEEKESTRQKKQKKQLKQQANILKEKEPKIEDIRERNERMLRNNTLDQDAIKFFQNTLRPELFSPSYVFNNFAQVRQKLDDWKEHLRFLGQGGPGEHLISSEQKIRIRLMRTMYERSEEAFTSALGALGYKYYPQESGDKRFQNDLTEEEKQRALEDNMRLRGELREQAKTIDEKVADQLIEEGMENQKEENAMEREVILARRPDLKRIETNSLSSSDEYSILGNLVAYMERNPEKYQKNKEVLDRMYQEVFYLLEAYQNDRLIVGAVYAEKEKTKDVLPNVWYIMKMKREKASEKIKLLWHRAKIIQSSMEKILYGEEFSKEEELIVREYGIMKEENELLRRKAEATAATYTEIYNEKKAILESLAESMYGEEEAKKLLSGDNNRYMMLMEPGQHEHNEAVIRLMRTRKTAEALRCQGGENAKEGARMLGTAAKPIVLPYLEKMRDYDTQTLSNCSDEELIERMEELQNLYISGMFAADLAKNIDPDDPEGRPIKAVFQGENKELFTLKCNMVQAYAVKARMLSMIKAYGQGALTAACFTSEEQRKIRSKYNLDENDEISMVHMLTFAKERLESNEASIDAAYNQYFHAEKIKEKYKKYSKQNQANAHPEYQKKLSAAMREARRVLGIDEWPNRKKVEICYKQYQERISEIKKELKELDKSDMRALELKTELKRLEEQSDLLELQHALTLANYSMADQIGEKECLIKEPIFRSYDSVESLPAFRGMSEGEFQMMCRQLAAGNMQKETATPEEIELYRAENVQGLLTYKKYMRLHYEMLEERFHHQVPSLEYIQEHYDELQQLFANIQVDENLVSHARDMIDLTKPEDLRLYHLVQIYNAMGGYILNVNAMAAWVMPDYKEAVEQAGSVMREQKASFDYLDEKEIQVEAEIQLKIEKFRKLGMEATQILQTSMETQIDFVQRVQELQEYVESQKEIPELTMKQLQGWLELAKKKTAVIAQRM